MGRPEWAPESTDPGAPSAAPVWDYSLAARHNVAVNRQVAEAAIAMKPATPQPARRVRLFLRRATRAIAHAGVDRFLDVGSGIPVVRRPSLRNIRRARPRA